MQPLKLPNLSDDFYTAHPRLNHVLRAARAHITPPDVVLGHMLARIAARIPVTATVNTSQVNIITALVGYSGTGKSQSGSVAAELLPDLNGALDSQPAGSGEGMVQAYLRLENGENVQAHAAALFHVDEGEQLLQAGGRQGSTTWPIIRSLWSGDTVGQSNAQRDTTRRLSRHTYRFALTVGMQPGYAGQLLSDKHAGDGTCQRFLWVGTGDPECPPSAPEWPGPLTWPHTIDGPFQIDPQIQRQVDDHRRQATMNGHHENPHDSHMMLLRLRTAACLTYLIGEPGRIGEPAWTAAQRLCEHSTNVRAEILAYREREHDAQKAREAIKRADIDAATEDMKEQRACERVARNISAMVGRNGQATKGRVNGAVAGRDRHLTDAAIAHAIERGWLRVDGDVFRPGLMSVPDE